MSGSKGLNTLHFTILLGRSIYRNFHRHVWITITEYLTFYHSTGRSMEISMDMSGLKLLNILHFTMGLVNQQKFSSTCLDQSYY